MTIKNTEYIEKIRHGSPEFPIAYYFKKEGLSRYVMNAHWHKELEIVRVLKGQFVLFLNGEKVFLNEGEICIIESTCLHRGEPLFCQYDCLVFDVSMLSRAGGDAVQKFIRPLLNNTTRLKHVISKDDALLYSQINQLFDIMRDKKPNYELDTYSLLFAILSQMYAHAYVQTSTPTLYSRQSRAVIDLIYWIENNLNQPISLDALAQQSGFNKKYLCRIFKEYTSKTIVDYINELRIEKACYEISELNESITNAAFNNGFNDLSYFCKLFKRYMGLTPKEYKAKNQPK